MLLGDDILWNVHFNYTGMVITAGMLALAFDAKSFFSADYIEKALRALGTWKL